MNTPRDTASILYPDDAPASSAGQAQPPQDGAAALYPNDRPKGGTTPPQPAQAQGEAGKDDPATLTYQDAAPFDAKEATSFFDQRALAAMQEGNRDNAAEWSAAGKALVEDMKAAGADAEGFNEALRAFNDAAYSGVTAAPEEIMTQLSQEFGPTLETDLAAARALIIELDRKAPGLIDSLEHTGAGNDPRLIRQAIREAKRRGITG